MPAYILEFLLVGFGLILLMIESFTALKNKAILGKLSAAALLVVFALLFAVDPTAELGSTFADYYHTDSAAIFFKGIALLTTLSVVLLSLDFLPVLRRGINGPEEADKGSQGGVGEFFSLPLFTCAGLMWMASAKDLVTILVALETVTISFYVLVASMRRNVGSLEAGVKYLILGALSTGFLVYGIAWVFGATGTLSLEALSAASPEQWATWAATPTLMFGVVLVLIALGFKVGAAPMQLWIPDVYQGAPTPITAFLSVGSKAAGFIVLWRFLTPFLASEAMAPQIILILAFITGATLIIGNLAAIGQSNFKRLLAYSSIAHAGFLLLGIVSGAPFSTIGFYLGAYLLMTIIAFAVLTVIRTRTGSDELVAFDGLAKRSPFLAFALVVAMSSLAGVPLTAGFWGKFLVIAAALEAGHYILLAIAIIGAAAGFYYYLKVLKNVFWNEPDAGIDIDTQPIGTTTKALIIAYSVGIFFFGIYPTPLFKALEEPATPTQTAQR